MKVLLLSPYPELLTDPLKDAGDTYEVSMATPDVWPGDADYVVSFGYRHIIKEPYLGIYKDRLINIHMSILPWNRGADPNFWSWLDKTPKGVSVHRVTAGVDEGPVIGQMNITKWQPGVTLRESYKFLQSCAGALFGLEWENWRIDKSFVLPQVGTGSYHRSGDKTKLMKKLPLQWDTPCSEVEKLGDELNKEKKDAD